MLIDDELPSLDEAAQSVDALVSDDPFESFPGPPLPEPNETVAKSSSHDPPSGMSQTPSTPTISPAQPRVLPKDQGPSTTTQANVTPEQTPKKGVSTPGSSNKKTIKALASETGLSKAISAQAKPEPHKTAALLDEDFPALDTPKSTKSSAPTPVTPVTPASKSALRSKKKTEKLLDKLMDKIPSSPEPKSAPAPPEKPAAKAVGMADTAAAATTTPKKEDLATKTERPESESAAVNSATGNPAAFPPLPTPGPSATQRAPKTLRIMQTPKAETPLASPALTMASRALSLSHRPETPGSEFISDTASVFSNSVSASRAGSPPPATRIGSAAVRNTTKSQQRKARKDALKQETIAIAEPAKPEPEEQAPILGRKKKQKKEKPPKAQPKTPSKAAEQESPEPTEENIADEPKGAEVKVPEKGPEVQKKAQEKMSEKKAKKAIPDDEIGNDSNRVAARAMVKGKIKELVAKAQEVTTPPAAAAPVAPHSAHVEEDDGERSEYSPMSIFNEIKDSLQASVEELRLLRPLTGSLSRTDHSVNLYDTETPPQCRDNSCRCGEILDADVAALRAGKPIRKSLHINGTRMLITPNGDCIKSLTEDEEDAFIELQNDIAATSENPGAFIAPRHQPGSGAFSLIKGRAVPNGRPNIFPASPQPFPSDPMTKLQREDALSYINQYVLPRLGLGSSNIGFPKGSGSTRDAAAASLNSLAPYFYGPDAAAGVGIYSAPDGTRAIQDYGPGMHTYASEDGKVPGLPGVGPGGVPLMSVEDAESALTAARKETEKLEKGLNQVIKRNRRLLVGAGN